MFNIFLVLLEIAWLFLSDKPILKFEVNLLNALLELYKIV
jgi:hypothetical protein